MEEITVRLRTCRGWEKRGTISNAPDRGELGGAGAGPMTIWGAVQQCD
jgi:hypothetical protein